MGTLAIQLAIGGGALGAAAALSAMGVLLTYRSTGVFNFAQGAIATLVAYVYWQLRVAEHLPLAVAVLVAVLVVGPGTGLILERFIFRPLQRRGASTSEKLVATLGVFTVLTAGVTLLWGIGTKTNIPLVLPQGTWRLGRHIYVDRYDVYSLLLLLLLAGALGALLRYTRLGRDIRAVVDRRELAELTSVNANRVAAFTWALGCGFAGLTGVLLLGTAEGLNNYAFTLIVLETFAVAVIARLVSLPLAIAGGIGLYVLQSELLLRIFHLTRAPWNSIRTELAAIALFAFLLVYRHLDEIGAGSAGGTAALVTGILGRRARRGPLGPAAGAVGVAALVALPLLAGGSDLRTAQEALALFVAFLAITSITGFAGYITLGTAGFAGLGALVSAKTADGIMPGLPKLPVPVAVLVAALLCAAVGFAAGYPALRRRGLILGLVTLAVNLILYRLIFGQVYFEQGTLPSRPRPFGLSGDRVFFCFELAVAALAVFFTHNLRSGRLGRILAAIRDSETGAQAVGISLRRYKLFIFSVSAGLAGVGGALLTQQTRAFNPDDFQPLYSLFWFTAVVVAGLSYISGAALAAGLYVGLDALFGRPGASQIVIGLGALAIGFLPGGIVGVLSRARRRGFVPRTLYARFRAAREAARSPSLPLPALARPGVVLTPPAATGGPPEVLVPSGFARRVLAEPHP